ncbi:GntR family transcriptional regulator [Actinocrinis puniceicyclus]|uniref:GntR family transcriptional regulator n=1 Tax=Actinocrinis puniceicyclus TaxID=977794 RepID=A0A8J8BAI6_9ACTN|nr:GntR family transcriptional regulator [Actinocrinis puniceicyclus]MBS2962093.1 GntR family transcriptional regulator [Actinocrinis puniceicyclus]
MAKYERIAAELRQKIMSGSLAPGEQLDPESKLAEEYGVTIPTARQALSVLRAEGLIITRHGKGRYVRSARTPVRRTPERYQWEKARVHLPEEQRRATGATEQDTGLTYDDLKFSAEYDDIPADEQLAEDFKVEPGTRMLLRTYRTTSRHESAPISLSRSYLVYDVAAQNPALLDQNNEPWPGGTQHQLSTLGIEVDRITDEITARPPLADEAEQLGIDAQGVSVFELKRTSVDTAGHVAEVAYVILPGDRTEFIYTTTLERWETA